MRLWWERLFRLLPGAHFEPQQLLVSGWPWATRIAMLSKIDGPLPDGTRYQNTLTQFMGMRWGRITEIHTLEDVQTLIRALDVVAAAGNPEAHAPPITDADGAAARISD